jgi:GDPmannose 4,6-dehydratase
VRIDSRLFRPHEVPLLLGSATKARQKLDWQPNVTFRQLAEMMYRSDYEKIKEDIGNRS